MNCFNFIDCSFIGKIFMLQINFQNVFEPGEANLETKFLNNFAFKNFLFISLFAT